MTGWKRCAFVALSLLATAVISFGEAPQIITQGVQEEHISSFSGRRSSIAVDSLNQPHTVTDVGMSPTLGLGDKINGQWSSSTFEARSRWSWLGMAFNPKIAIDSADRAWYCIPGVTVHVGGGLILLIRNTIATAPTRPYASINAWSTIDWEPGTMAVDPNIPGQAIGYSWNGQWARFVYNGIPEAMQYKAQFGTLFAGYGGEKMDIKISTGAYAHRSSGTHGVWHAATEGYHAYDAAYQNSVRQEQGLRPVFFASYPAYPGMGGDSCYPRVCPDSVNPLAAYIASDYGGGKGIVMNIWDGTKMLYSIYGNLTIDAGGTCGSDRWAPAVAQAKEGGAFIAWQHGANIKAEYVALNGSKGPIVDLGPGARPAICTDSQGNLHVVYIRGGGVKYKKFNVSHLAPITPKDNVSVTTRRPLFGWSNVHYARYNIEIFQYANATTTATTWTPGSDLPVGRYYWRVEAYNNDSDRYWSSWVSFLVPPTTPSILTPTDRITAHRPTCQWTDADDADWYNLEIYKNGVLYQNKWIQTNDSWTATSDFPNGAYQSRVRAYTTAFSPGIYSLWSPTASFQINVPGMVTLVTHEERHTITNKIDFAWTATDGAVWYQIWIGKDGAPFASRWLSNSTSCTITQNFTLGEYSWYVQGYNSSGYGPWSEPDFSCDVQRNMTPGDRETLPSDTSKPTFVWTPTPGCGWYQLWIERQGPGSNDTVRPFFNTWLNQTAGTWTPPLSGTPTFTAGSYTWYVRDWTGGRSSMWSANDFQIGAPGQAIGLSPRGTIETNHVEFTWQAGNAAQWYYLWIGKGADASFYRDAWISSTNWTTDLATTPSDYVYWVRTWSTNGGYGRWSTPANLTVE